MRLLLVGQAPSRETDGKSPFVGRCGAFLADLMGLSQAEMLQQHDFLNVLNYWPGKGINGDKFPMREAEKAAMKMLPSMRGRVAILLGSNVARAFGAKNFQYFQAYEIRNPDDAADIVVPAMFIMPHPSGKVRTWNVPQNRDTARKFFSQLLSSKVQE